MIGLGISGRSAASLLLKKGASVWGVDSNLDLIKNHSEIALLRQQGLCAQHESEPIEMSQFDLVVVSPGISPSHRLYSKAYSSGIKIIGEVELAFRFLKGTVLGVTGTNGKTTVTLMTAHILNQSGRPARALGNVGTALSAECEIPSGAITVAELSSFQLDTLNSPVIDAAVLLNITPDHLDRYKDMVEYARSKLHIAHCLKPGGALYIEHRCFQEFGHLLSHFIPQTYGYSSNCDLFTDLKQICYKNCIECELPPSYQGKVSHDLENIMAAYALCKYVGITPEQFFKALRTFKKPAHRIEFVRKLRNVSYYDDSKGTNIDAVVRAIDSLEGNIILIAGGVDKGAAYTPWIEAFTNKVRYVCAIGQAAAKIKRDIGQQVPVELFNTLEEAVKFASTIAQAGENVLLSPGCSSFDMFKDYAHRGEEFQRIVKQL